MPVRSGYGPSVSAGVTAHAAALVVPPPPVPVVAGVVAPLGVVRDAAHAAAAAAAVAPVRASGSRLVSRGRATGRTDCRRRPRRARRAGPGPSWAGDSGLLPNEATGRGPAVRRVALSDPAKAAHRERLAVLADETRPRVEGAHSAALVAM